MHFSDQGNFFALLIGVILLAKKLAQMDRYQDLRVLILTVLFSSFVLYFLVTSGFIEPIYSDCTPEHFCMTEM